MAVKYPIEEEITGDSVEAMEDLVEVMDGRSKENSGFMFLKSHNRFMHYFM